jgi:uncharacterized protein YegP (UPF0339 family)
MAAVNTHQSVHVVKVAELAEAGNTPPEPPAAQDPPAPEPAREPPPDSARLLAPGSVPGPIVDEVFDVRAVTSLVFESHREGDEWRWRLRADGFRLLAESDASFATMRECERAIVIVRAQARFAHTHLRQDGDGRWRWWLLGGGGRVLARSAVVYTTRFVCAMEIGLLRPAIADAVSLRSLGRGPDSF